MDRPVVKWSKKCRTVSKREYFDMFSGPSGSRMPEKLSDGLSQRGRLKVIEHCHVE